MNLHGFLTEYKKILSLEHVPIVMRKDPECKFDTELEWHPSERVWCIWYKKDLSKYYIAHELGHLYLAKITSFPNFALQTPDNKHIDRRLHCLFNDLLDIFVDYNLSCVKTIYPILSEKLLGYLLYMADFKEFLANIHDFMYLLSFYPLFYLNFNYILNSIERDKYKNEIQSFLNSLKTRIVNKKKKSIQCNRGAT
ncbi:MAG: hypothetical protein ACTSVV_00210 [Promethearchaeota archaeon]